MAKIKQPKIRFKGYIADWEQRKLGDLGNFKNGMNFDKNAMGNGYPFVNLQDVFEKPIVKKEELGLAEATPNQLKDYNLLEGDVLFVRSSVKREGVGLTAIIPEDFINTTYSGFIIRFRSTEELSKEYKQFVFSTPTLRNQILIRSTSGANTNINQDNLKILTIPIPNIEEQKKIGEFFKTLDDTISLHQQKLEVTKQFKQTMLKKMFHKNGKTKPEIRFKGFTDDWEECKLRDLCSLSTGKLDANAMTSDGKYTFFTSGEKVYKTDTFAFDGDAILIAGNGNVGLQHTYNGKFNAYQRTYVLMDFEINKEILSKQIDLKLPRVIARETRVGVIPYIVKDMLTELTINFPKNIKEQDLIGNYFKELDNQINALEKKLETYKEFKKAMLQKMFI